MAERVLDLEVWCEDDESVARVTEILARTMTGLTLDGVRCTLSTQTAEEDETKV